MPAWMRRLAAAYALGALLACSSVGTCWLRLSSPAAHHCCEKGVNVKPAKPCAAEVTSVVPVVLEAPAASPALLAAPPVSPAVLPEAAFRPVLPVRDPPLVLRI
jgi:hypothetical protein